MRPKRPSRQLKVTFQSLRVNSMLSVPAEVSRLIKWRNSCKMSVIKLKGRLSMNLRSSLVTRTGKTRRGSLSKLMKECCMKGEDASLTSLILRDSLRSKRIGLLLTNGTQNQIKTSPRNYIVTAWLSSLTIQIRFTCRIFRMKHSIDLFFSL